MIYTTRTRSESKAELVEFGFSDDKGRRLGVLVSTLVATYTEKPEDAQGGWTQAPGTYFVANVQTTRNGQCFGAGQCNKEFATVAERDAFVARRIEEARARYAKKFGAQ
jgi:hypothetical protein